MLGFDGIAGDYAAILAALKLLDPYVFASGVIGNTAALLTLLNGPRI